ncbi:type VII secretion-associated protein [Rhodococcus rhodnii]|uniref:Esx cluster membrane protein n=2 Tax=Rhodococcus rhodnii TaxID=38312 RepID=R7WHP1_9NOCA|nr:type VII secretion-associated protein [Rhodococcus rhodnii]EOM74648.1 esx cluster membrane protein [Rhodococcus rhodnii LMG 5362]TXG90433.1 type VII secretion-associated protein [Rhodococcus rhodnii]
MTTVLVTEPRCWIADRSDVRSGPARLAPDEVRGGVRASTTGPDVLATTGARWVLVEGEPIRVADALAAVTGTVHGSRDATWIVPSYWGARRRGAVLTGAGEPASSIPLARAASLRASMRADVAVVEIYATAVCAVRTPGVVTTDLDAPVAAEYARIDADPVECVARVLAAVCAGAAVSEVLVYSASGQPVGETLYRAVRPIIGPHTAIREMGADEIVAAVEAAYAASGGSSAPRRRRPRGVLGVPGASAPRRRAPSRPLWVGVAVVGMLVAAVGVVLQTQRGDTAAPNVASPNVSAPDGETPAAPPVPVASAPGVAAVVDLGAGLEAVLPAGWRDAPERRGDLDGVARAELLPESGDPARIVIERNSLDGPRSLADIGAELADAATATDGRIDGVDASATFGGRPVVAYVETPGDGSTVRWFVIPFGEREIQISVGCQYRDSWFAVHRPCQEVVAGVGAP